MTRDEALLWLNDRIGKSVHVSVVLERGDSKITVVNGDRHAAAPALALADVLSRTARRTPEG
jgi:hypothetical protein